MGRPELPVDPLAGAVERLAWELRRLRDKAGRPSYRELARRAHFSHSTLAEVATGTRLPTLEAALAYAVACGGERAEWEARWRDAAAELERSRRRCPYPGLAPLGSEDADLFYGRAELAEELLKAVRGTPLTAVFGASGSGKSSLLLAGLLPALAADGIRNAVMTPGPHPLEALTGALAAVTTPEGPRAVLVIDQFEEAFTLCLDETERDEFFDALTELAGAADGRPALVIGVRTDFYGHCARHAGLVAALRSNVHMPIGPLSEHELRDIITGPAGRVGLTVEPDLVATVVAEATGEPGALPLIAHALRETWSRVEGDVLRLMDYRATGGVREAVARTAERLYEEFDDAHREIVRSVFLRLTALGEATEDTRRRMERDELTGIGEPGEIDAVLDRLAAARLVVVDHGTVDVAHEALIGAWPRLRRWLTTGREDLLAHQRLIGAAAEWDRAGRTEEFLYRGSRLAAWAERDPAPLNELEQAFLAAGRRREAAEHGAARRRVRLGFGGLGLTAAVVSVLAVLALVQAGRTADERDRAVSRQLAADARSQLNRDPELALLLATKAYETKRTEEADIVLRQAILDSRPRRSMSTGHADIRGAAFSPDGQKAATLSPREIRTWSWDGQRLSQVGPVMVRKATERSAPATVTFGPGGRLLAVGHHHEKIEVWDLTRNDGPKVLRGRMGDLVGGVAFSGDGNRLASTHRNEVRIWDLTGERKPVTIPFGRRSVDAVAFSPDGKRIATGGSANPAQIWDVTRERPRLLLTSRHDTGRKLAFSPDGLRLIAATNQNTAQVYLLPTRPTSTLPVESELRGHEAAVAGIAFHPDGRRLATYGPDHTIRIWSTDFHTSPLVLRSPSDETRGIAFSPDGLWLTSVNQDGTVRAWDITIGEPVALDGRSAGETMQTLSANGRALAAVRPLDGTIRVWDTGRGGPPTILRGRRGSSRPLALSPDGRQVVGRGDDQTLLLWDLAGKAGPRVLRGGHSDGGRATFSRDGRRLARVDSGNMLRIWETTGRDTPTTVLGGYTGLDGTMDFSPDGRRLAASLHNGTIVVHDLAGKQKPMLLRGHAGAVNVLKFSPDGWQLASGGTDGTVRMWKTTAPHTSTAVLYGDRNGVGHLAFSPDGRWLASTAQYGDGLRLWRMTGGTDPVVVTGFGASIADLAFGPDGRQMTIAHGSKPVRIWQCEVCGAGDQMLRLARQRATRELTAEERRIYHKAP